MPIHQTKLMMSKPQPTGLVTPQIPVPRSNRLASVWPNSITPMNPMPNPTHHPLGVRCVRTKEPILSETDPKVWPGSMIGGLSGSTRIDLVLVRLSIENNDE